MKKTKKELAEKYRRMLREGKPVHGEAREIVIDNDLRKEEETREREQQE